MLEGLWTDPVTGVAYARARWYDARNGVFLTEDPMGSLDSSNLYAFGAWAPSMHTDPTGEFVPQLLGGVASVGIGWGVSKLCEWMVDDEEAKEDCRYTKEDAGVDFALGAATMGLSNISKLRHVSKLGAVGRVGVRATAEIGLDVGAEVTRRELKGEDWTLGEVTVGAGRNFLVGEAGAAVGRRFMAPVKRHFQGLGDKTTSPWLADPRAGVASHIESFRGGASFPVPKSVHDKFLRGASIVGDPGAEQFVVPRDAMDRLLKRAKGDRGYVKKALGIGKEHWNEDLVRVDVHNPLLYNVRMPWGFEETANEFFRWGGVTSGGMPEAVMDRIPRSGVTISEALGLR